MERRGFLTTLAAFAATAVIDPDRLLWVPGKKLISIPAASANILTLPSMGATFRVGDTFDLCKQRVSRTFSVIEVEPGQVSVSRLPWPMSIRREMLNTEAATLTDWFSYKSRIGI
jgi:hypothetical protein